MDCTDLNGFDGTEPTIEEDFYCEACEIDCVVISERVKGCHWCETAGSVRYDEEEDIWYCYKCHVMTESPQEEHFYRWVETEPAEKVEDEE